MTIVVIPEVEELMKRPEEKQVPSILKRLFAFLNQTGMLLLRIMERKSCRR